MNLEDVRAMLVQHERLTHRDHQLLGVCRLIERRTFALFDEVGAGKSKQVVDAAQVLYLQGLIDTVVVLTPGFARSTWVEQDPLLGEVAKHCWTTVRNTVFEFHGKNPVWTAGLNWLVSNYEFIRRPERLDELLTVLHGRRTWLVLDESWALKGNTQQMKACRKLRWTKADRVTILNGTPLSDGKATDLYYPFSILDPDIIGVKTRAHFTSRYCIMGGYLGKQIIGYQHLDDLNRRIAPHVLSRRTRDCFDLPPMLDPVLVEAKLSPATWKIYKEMRDEMVTYLGTAASIAPLALVKALRLSQITSGYLGGVHDTTDVHDDVNIHPAFEAGRPEWIQEKHGNAITTTTAGEGTASRPSEAAGATREVGCEKLDAFLGWLHDLEPYPKKLLVWCRFRKEVERTGQALESYYPVVAYLKGGQLTAERDEAKRLLAPGGDPRPSAVVGNQKAGGASLNFAAASIVIYLSNGPALIERTQSVGRIERPGQTSPMTVVDIVAVGPEGQKTIDHHILKSLRAKDDMARWTVDQWRRILEEQ